MGKSNEEHVENVALFPLSMRFHHAISATTLSSSTRVTLVDKGMTGWMLPIPPPLPCQQADRYGFKYQVHSPVSYGRQEIITLPDFRSS